MGAGHNAVYNIVFPLSMFLVCFHRFLPIAICAKEAGGMSNPFATGYCFPKVLYEAVFLQGTGAMLWGVRWALGALAVTEFVKAECHRALIPNASMWAYVACVHLCGYGGGMALILLYYPQWSTNDYWKAIPVKPSPAIRQQNSKVIITRFKLLQHLARIAVFSMVLVHFSYSIEYKGQSFTDSAYEALTAWSITAMNKSLFIDCMVATLSLMTWVWNETSLSHALWISSTSLVLGSGYAISLYMQEREHRVLQAEKASGRDGSEKGDNSEIQEGAETWSAMQQLKRKLKPPPKDKIKKK